MSGEVFCARSGDLFGRLLDVRVQEVDSSEMMGCCDSCGMFVSGKVGIGRIVLDGEEGVCVGICAGDEFHPVAQVPWSRLKKQ